MPRSVGGRRSSAATREKPAPPGIPSCAQGTNPGLVGAPQRYSVFARFASMPSAAHAPGPLTELPHFGMAPRLPQVRGILQSALSPPGPVKLGPLLAEMGREAQLTHEEFAVFERLRSQPQAQ